MLLDGEKKRIRNAVSERVHQLAGTETGACSTLFRVLYRSLKEQYEVDSYQQIPRDKVLDAVNFISSWGGETFEART